MGPTRGRLGRFRMEILRSACAAQIDPDYFAGGGFDVAVLERVRLRSNTVEIKRNAKLLGIVRTAGLGAQLQPLRAGRIGAAVRAKLAFAVSRCRFVLHCAFDAAVVVHAADAQTGYAQ